MSWIDLLENPEYRKTKKLKYACKIRCPKPFFTQKELNKYKRKPKGISLVQVYNQKI